MIKTYTLGSVMTLLLGACAYHAPHETINTAMHEQIAAPLNWSEASVANAIGGNWLDDFDDEHLSALIVEAINANRDIQIAADNVARSAAFLRQSRAALLPSLNASASANETGALGGGTSSRTALGVNLNANWEADIWGQLSADKASSIADLYANEARLQSARLSLASRVARAYFLSIESKLQIDLNLATLEAQEDTLRIVEARKNAGFSARQDLVLAISNVASARDNLASARNAHRDALRALQVLLWRYPDTKIDLTDTLPDLPKAIPAGTPVELLQRRPDILAADAEVRSAFALTARVKADRWPSLNFSSRLNGNASNVGDLFDGPNLGLNIGAMLAAPLFDGGLRRAQIDAAKASQRQALARYGQSVLNAFADVETGLDRWRTLQERGGYLVVAEEAANETLRLAQLRYQAGETDLLDVLQLRQRAFAASRSRLANQRARLDARLDLYLALGGAF